MNKLFDLTEYLTLTEAASHLSIVLGIPVNETNVIAKVQEWLGHANIATTRIYDHRKTRLEDSPTFKVSY